MPVSTNSPPSEPPEVVLLGHQTLTGAAASFTQIPISGTYKMFEVFIMGQNNGAAEQVAKLRFNADTGNNYHGQFIMGEVAAASAGQFLNQSGVVAARIPATTWGCGRIQVFQGSTATKVFIATTGQVGLTNINVGYWNNAAAITTIDVAISADSFDIGSMLVVVGYK